jgi:hypothetical protein
MHTLQISMNEDPSRILLPSTLMEKALSMTARPMLMKNNVILTQNLETVRSVGIALARGDPRPNFRFTKLQPIQGMWGKLRQIRMMLRAMGKWRTKTKTKYATIHTCTSN